MKEYIDRCEELIKDEHKEWIGISNQNAIKELLKTFKENQNEEFDYTTIYLDGYLDGKLKYRNKIKNLLKKIENNEEVSPTAKYYYTKILNELLEGDFDFNGTK